MNGTERLTVGGPVARTGWPANSWVSSVGPRYYEGGPRLRSGGLGGLHWKLLVPRCLGGGCWNSMQAIGSTAFRCGRIFVSSISTSTPRSLRRECRGFNGEAGG